MLSGSIVSFQPVFCKKTTSVDTQSQSDILFGKDRLHLHIAITALKSRISYHSSTVLFLFFMTFDGDLDEVLGEVGVGVIFLNKDKSFAKGIIST